jgi:hypothetical protein
VVCAPAEIQGLDPALPDQIEVFYAALIDNMKKGRSLG